MGCMQCNNCKNMCTYKIALCYNFYTMLGEVWDKIDEHWVTERAMYYDVQINVGKAAGDQMFFFMDHQSCG